MNDTTLLRVPPHSIESESSVLGSLMFDGEAFHKIADILTEDDFYRSEHRVIFAAIKAMLSARKSVELFTALPTCPRWP
jgi:replicative DNA helicase